MVSPCVAMLSPLVPVDARLFPMTDLLVRVAVGDRAIISSLLAIEDVDETNDMRRWLDSSFPRRYSMLLGWRSSIRRVARARRVGRSIACRFQSSRRCFPVDCSKVVINLAVAEIESQVRMAA